MLVGLRQPQPAEYGTNQAPVERLNHGRGQSQPIRMQQLCEACESSALVSVFCLDEVLSAGADSTFSWPSQGLSAMLQPLPSEAGELDGGLCLGTRALCTWAERDVLQPGTVYVVKAFRPEVVRVWRRHFPGSVALQLYGAVGGEMLFGPDNLGDTAINRFLLKHACNLSCRLLGLSELRRASDARGNDGGDGDP
ncbi:hypothetical protein CRUP_010917 [Coryphaenoides rupestris]|nr:hypothetical protein CRUP_010917 [Coryphaenoides rupestris]